MKPSPVICLAGPTGCGKTELAIEIAKILDCEIINADSRQVYKDFPILTAQPGEDEKQGIPHHLYGFLGINEKINAGKWAELAFARVRTIIAAGSIPLLVGGTGFYFNALLSGLAAIPAIPEEIRRKVCDMVDKEGSVEIYKILVSVDPEYSAKVHAHDKNRIMRALEVHMATGKNFSWWHKNAKTEPLCQGPLLVLNTSLKDLTPLLDMRISAMLTRGGLEEAKAAFNKCSDLHACGWSSIGCAETGEFLQGNINFAECRRLWLANTRAYAKRQITWFRSRPRTVWCNRDNVWQHLNGIRNKIF